MAEEETVGNSFVQVPSDTSAEDIVAMAKGEMEVPTVDEAEMPEPADDLVEIEPATAPTKRGQPTKYTEATVGLIIGALQRGLSVEDACVTGGIARDTFYTWLKEHPEFSDRVERAKTRLIRQSLLIISNAIEKDKDKMLAKWYLERRTNDFRPGQQVDLGGSVEVHNKDENLLAFLNMIGGPDAEEPDPDTEAPSS